MNRCIESRNRAESASLNSRMVDGGIARVDYRVPGQQVVPEEVPRRANIRLEFDQSAGWPPQLAGVKHQQCLTPSRAEVSFDLKAQDGCRKAALKHPDVLTHLVGRWETLGIHLVSHRDTPCQVDIRASVCLFNYTTNQLIEVHVEDGIVTNVRIGEPYEHPEAPIEMAQAISLARSHPQIKSQVADLTAHAILSVPTDPSVPSYKHRCLLVMFTRQNDVHRELPVLFSALIDLCEQRVLAFSRCPCTPETGHTHQEISHY